MFKTQFFYKKFRAYPFPTSTRTVTVFRPIIPVIVIFKNKFVKFEALIDSGADYNVFHGDIAAYLGIRLNRGSRRNIIGIGGGKIKGYEHFVDLKIESYIFQTKITFSNQIPNNSLAVLGNRGFFDKLVIKFDYHNKTICLER